MSTNAATVDARRYRVRLVQPDPAGTITVLGRTYSGRFLPTSFSKDSSDFVEGSYTRRFGDAGEWSLTFPNVAASDDVLWRERFDPSGALQWVELYRELDLEYVGLVERVEVDRGRVEVSGSDGWALLKRAYERDRHWCAAPLEVLHHYTGVPVLELGEDFDGGSLAAGWAESNSGTTRTFPGDSTWTITGTGAPGIGSVYFDGAALQRDTFRAQAYLPQIPKTGAGSWSVALVLYWGPSLARYTRVTFRSSNTAEVREYEGDTGFDVAPAAVPVDVSGPLTLTLEAQGRSIRGYVNGQLIGYLPNGIPVGGDRIELDYISVEADGLAAGDVLKVDRITVTTHERFLQGSTPTGRVAATGQLPGGGLRGRYYNDSDVSGLIDPNYSAALLDPEREPYGERLDSSQSTSAGLALPLQPGAPTTGYYARQRWTGSLYVNPGVGATVSFTVAANAGGGGFRVRFGDTRLDAEAFNGWQIGSSGGGGGAVAIPDGAGWYPFIVERYGINSAAPTWVLQMTVAGTGTYVDPGGTTVTRGSAQTIPATSLSPLGIYEERVQGQSHFDVVAQVAKEFGLELLLEPRSLESGEFPGRLIPRLRVGRDTDMVLTVEDDERGTPILSPGATTDATEQTVHLLGNAQGLGGGSRGSVTAEVLDVAGAGASLFQLQTWLDAGDIGFPELLEARLGAELALRSTPWQEVRGNPYAQDRLADTFPLTGVLEAFRWTPGDGIRVRVPEVGVDDTSPRRITQLTRTFGVNGRTGAQVSFRNRPRGQAVALGALARASLKGQRTRTPQLVTVDGETVVESVLAASYGPNYARLFLLPEDRIVRCYLRVALLTFGSLSVEVNGVDRTAALGGPWTGGGPMRLDVTPYATKNGAGDGRVFFRMYNNSGTAGSIEWQPTAEVLR